jgi:uncharacterized repeat protein (TIGR01451 family)
MAGEVYLMSKLAAILKRQSLYLIMALSLVLVTLAPLATPVHVTAGSGVNAPPLGSSREVLDSGQSLAPRSHGPAVVGSNQGMRVWLPPARPVGAPPVRPLLDAIKTVQIESPIGTQISTKSLTADQNFTFHAVGYNGVTSTQEVTWTLSAAIGTLSTGRGESTTLDATTVGSANLRAQLVTTPSISTTARITVTPGAAHHIVVRTGANNSGAVAGNHAMTTDETWPLYAAGYDADNNYVGDLSVSWSVIGDNIGVVAPTTGTSTVLDARRPGTGRVRADHTAVIDGETGDIDVSVGAPSYITIRTGANNGGAPAGDHAMTTDDVWQLYAAGYDADNNYIADLEVDWSVTGDNIGVVAPARASATILDARRPGTGRVRANHLTAIDGETGNIDVSVGALDHIVIQDRAGASGNEVTDHTMTIYDTYTVWATGYDADDNYIAEQAVDWSVTGVLLEGQIAPSSGISTTFTPAPVLSGTGRLNATYQGPPQLTDTTGDFTVKAPRLVIGKSDYPDPVSAGLPLGYTIVFTNVGEAAARNVRITETYDAHVSYQFAAPYQPTNPPPGAANIWAFDTLGAGASRTIFVTVLVDGSLAPGTTLNNQVTIGGARLEQDVAAESTIVTSVPSLTVTLTDQPDPVDAGNNLVYQVGYANQGNAPVHNVCITMTYDDHLVFVVSDPPPESGTDNVWCFAELPGGGSGDIDITVRVDEFMVDQDVLVSSVVGRSDETDESSAFAETVVNAPALSMKKSASQEPAVAFRPLAYTLVYTNVGHRATGALRITDAVPANTHYASCQPLPCFYSSSDRVVTWRNDSGLAAGASRSLTLVVNVDRNLDTGTLLSNRALVWVVVEPAYSAAVEVDTTVVSSPSLSLAISDGRTFVEAGDELPYTVSYNNSGTGRAYSTTIRVTPPALLYVENVRCGPASKCQVGSGEVVYDLGTVDGGVANSVLMTVTVRDPLPAGAIGNITATAVIETITPGDPPGDNVAQDVDVIATRPDLVAMADYQAIMPYPGKRVTYTVNYSNRGHIATTGVVITAAQPQYTTYDPGASSAWQDVGDGHYRFPVGELDYDEGGSLLFVVTLPAGVFTTTMTNFDAAFGIYDDGKSGHDGQPGNNRVLAPMGVPNLVIENVVVDRSVWLREPGLLTITIRNTGTGLACGTNGADGECRFFSVDVFTNPIPPPVSYPIEKFGNCFLYVAPIYAGLAQTAVMSFTTGEWGNEPGVCVAGAMGELWIHADNWDPSNLPPWPVEYGPVPPYGQVPESNEFDNVFGPVLPPSYLYLSLIVKNH